ncbi:CWC16 protein [Lipomyces arxii]|uniref:CWC16 protein n=1 Tax=Lipomyces arxii TaxID=56418 RepID=UPI0034CF9ED8
MQGYNKYYPPDYDGKTSLNKLAGTHSLGKRARKLDQGILVTRFELPFDIWCSGCEVLIAQGTRFNVEKKKVGAYYTTPIFSFRFKCHLCPNKIEIRTDPQNTAYVVTSGARKKVTEYDGDKIGAIKVESMFEHKTDNGDDDPFASVEKSEEQTKIISESNKRIAELYEHTSSRWDDPYTKNQILRKIIRDDKKSKEMKTSKQDSLEWKLAKVEQYKRRKNA